jgi:aconitate hydratase
MITGNRFSTVNNILIKVARYAPRLASTRGLATVSKVPMSLLEKDKFINYQKIEDNLKVVKDRYSV